MDSYPKRLRPLENDGHGVDRISELPDSIIIEILSLVPTKYAVVTTFLSTRWKHLFASVPDLTLDLDDSLFVRPHKEHAEFHSPNGTRNFVNHMYSVLNVILCDVEYIYKIFIRCKQDYSQGHINSWIGAALRFNVRELTISVANIDFIVFPRRLFHCSTLVKLSLDRRFVLDVPTSVCFPNLEFLYLKLVKFRDGDSVERLFNGCPVLEELLIEECEFEDMETLEISIPCLQILEIWNCFNNGIYEVKINTPALVCLTYVDYVVDYYPVKNLKCVRMAHLDLGLNEEQLEEEDSWIYEQNIAQLVAACSDVEDLYLSHTSMVAIHFSGESMPTFRNLTTLRLCWINEFGWKLLPYLLEASPNLEVLAFKEGISEYQGYIECVSALTEHLPRCLSSCLREIELEEFTGEEDDLKLIEYFLECTRVLKKMIISSELDSSRLLCITEKLLMLPSCSTNCEIVLRKGEYTILEFVIM